MWGSVRCLGRWRPLRRRDQRLDPRAYFRRFGLQALDISGRDHKRFARGVAGRLAPHGISLCAVPCTVFVAHRLGDVTRFARCRGGLAAPPAGILRQRHQRPVARDQSVSIHSMNSATWVGFPPGQKCAVAARPSSAARRVRPNPRHPLRHAECPEGVSVHPAEATLDPTHRRAVHQLPTVAACVLRDREQVPVQSDELADGEPSWRVAV